MQILKKILVTCALPYANDSIHLGHILEYIQADIWVRYKKMMGNKVYFICADDAHGTPIMLKAKKIGIKPENMINKIYLEHKRDISNFYINYDNYYSTHSQENYNLSIYIYKKLKKQNYIKSHFIYQFYDTKNNIFLPDRFIKGTCPKCNALNQFGDNCEICSTTYNAIDLINPVSLISGEKPIIKKSEHYFFDLPIFNNFLKSWIHSGVLQNQIIKKVQEWFDHGLKQWNISRDEPYFGFKIPNTKGKYFYVWMDAIIGYMSSFKNFCNKNKSIIFNDFWKYNSEHELCHFIGKDIIYFHSLFWPAILHGCNFRKPSNIFVHGYLTINGYKMSKSKGTFIKASTYLKYLDPDCLRYYYASKLSSKIEDINLNLLDFIKKVNTDIVNNIVNLVSRTVSFINKFFNNQLSPTIDNLNLYNFFVDSSILISKFFNNRDNDLAIKKIVHLANLANEYIYTQAPWKMNKQNKFNKKLHSVCSMGIQLFRIIMIYLKPVLPSLVKKTEIFLNTQLNWHNISVPLLSHYINPFTALFKRIEDTQIKFLI